MVIGAGDTGGRSGTRSRERVLRVLTAAGLLLLTLGDVAGGGEFIVLSEGTPVIVKTAKDLDPASLAGHDTVRLTVAERVKRDGYTLIRSGAPVKAGVLSNVTEGGDTKYLAIVSTEALDGQEVRLRATPERPEGEELSAALIPLPSPMPAGTTLRVFLAESYYIEE